VRDVPPKPLDADPWFLVNVCLLLCVTNIHAWTAWDVVCVLLAVANAWLFSYRLLKLQRWRRDIVLWGEEFEREKVSRAKETSSWLS
jgi:hypothetical protein